MYKIKTHLKFGDYRTSENEIRIEFVVNKIQSGFK